MSCTVMQAILSDFEMSVEEDSAASAATTRFGGTPAYMGPERLHVPPMLP